MNPEEKIKSILNKIFLSEGDFEHSDLYYKLEYDAELELQNYAIEKFSEDYNIPLSEAKIKLYQLINNDGTNQL